MNIKTIVNAEGQMLELAVAFDADGKAIGYEIKDGMRAVPYINSCLTSTNGILHPPLKPIWDFAQGKWLEKASEAELEAEYAINNIKLGGQINEP